MCFLSSCQYCVVSLTGVREQRFIRIIYYSVLFSIRQALYGKALLRVSRFALTAGKQKNVASISLRLSSLLKSCGYGHCLCDFVTVNKTLKCLSLLPVLIILVVTVQCQAQSSSPTTSWDLGHRQLILGNNWALSKLNRRQHPG